jgi:2-methylcitrate dehydratase
MRGRDGVASWSWDIDALIGGLGESYKITECSMKAFPTEALSHTHLTCTLKVMLNNNLDYSDIAEVEVTTLAQAYDILFDPAKYRPESRETADHSLPYCLAAAIVDKKITIQSFSDEKLNDTKIFEVIDKIKGVPSIEFEKMFPAKQPSKVVIRTNDGREFSEYIEYPKGDPREPMTMEDLENKFNALSAGLISDERQKAVQDVIFNCEEMSAAEFMNKLIIK